METEEKAEVAFVIREDFQGAGVATYLLSVLENIARENNYKYFSATVLRENSAMIHVFKKRYPHAKTSLSGGSDISILMDFEDSIRVDEQNKDAASVC
jgi:GNAT superfamily N-acetyltransferase